jgi:hypothetical protein
MFLKLQKYFKRKEYKLIDSYFEDGHEIKIKEDEDGKQIISLRRSENNQLIEITIDDSKIKHVIYDGLRGVTQEINVPMNIYEKIIDLDNPRSVIK